MALKIPPDFAYQKIEKWDDEYFRQLQPFVKEYQWNSCAAIDLRRIVGAKHPGYAEKMTWLDFLQRGKKMDINLQLYMDNPSYYLSSDSKHPVMDYLCIDGGDLYIGQDGNHRSAIAKFAFHYLDKTILHGVTVSNYIIDWDLKSLFEDIQEELAYHGIQVEPRMLSPVRDDGPGWMKEKYQVEFRLINFKRHKTTILSKQELVALAQRAKNMTWLDRIFKNRLGNFKEIL